MADKGITFNDAMDGAIWEDRKSQTRRLATFIQPQDDGYWHARGNGGGMMGMDEAQVREFGHHYSPYASGDRLYVRASYFQFGHWEPVEGVLTKGGKQKWAFVGVPLMVQFAPPADFLVSRSKVFPGMPRWHKRLGRFMPRTLSRTTLTVTDVRVQRLQDISEADALAEGVVPDPDGGGFHVPGVEHPNKDFPCLSRATARGMYAALWDTLHGSGEWLANPWICAVSFDVRRGNIDAEAQNG